MDTGHENGLLNGYEHSKIQISGVGYQSKV
jgi:hypothetical protein